MEVIILLVFAAAGACYAFAAIVDKIAEKKFGKEEWERVCKEQEEYNKEENVIERERIAAIDSQNATEPWAVRYSTSPCPHCGHYKVRNAKWEDKSLSVAFWGIASSKIDNNFKCEHCKRMW